jgi:hypothetical protein
MHTRLSLHGTTPPALQDAAPQRSRARGWLPLLGAAIGVSLTVARPLAGPRQDHALLMELARRELIHCQDQLGKLRQLGTSDDQAVDETIRTMAAQVAAATEAECTRLKQVVDAAAESEAERATAENPGPATPPGPARPGAAPPPATPPAATAPEPAPAPAAPPAAPVPPPPEVEARPAEGAPSVTPVPAAQSPVPTLAIHLPAASGSAAAEARTLAAQFGSNFQRTATHSEPETPPKALVYYADQADHAVAKRIAQVLADQHYTWRLEHRAAPSGAASRTVEVWIPAAPRSPAKEAPATRARHRAPAKH